MKAAWPLVSESSMVSANGAPLRESPSRLRRARVNPRRPGVRPARLDADRNRDRRVQVRPALSN
jgi:hypothetical protein